MKVGIFILVRFGYAWKHWCFCGAKYELIFINEDAFMIYTFDGFYAIIIIIYKKRSDIYVI